MKAHIASESPRSAKKTVSGTATERLTYTVAEAASALGVSRSSIYRLLYRGLLVAVPGLRHKLISRAAITSFVGNGGRHD